MNNTINYLLEYTYENTENLKYSQILNKDENHTHFIQFDNQYDFNIISNVINKLKFKNIDLIIQKSNIIRNRKLVPKNNTDRIICNCINSCNCNDKYFVEVEDDEIVYSYFFAKPELYVENSSELIYGLGFKLN
jgi:hypothetical protein